MPPPPPPLMDELVEECLLRLPPDDPASLVRATLVCKRWRRIVADGGFSRRFRELHRKPPLLGFLHENTRHDGPCFTPTSSFRPCNADLLRGRHVIDSRHGRVLLMRKSSDLTVWDPISGDQLDLPEPPPPQLPHWVVRDWRAAVLCASAASCDHLDCHRGHFLVIFMDTSTHHVCTYVYSSKAGSWSPPSRAAQDLTDPSCLLYQWPVAMAGNALYFSFHRKMITGILRYDLGTHEVSWVDLPPDCCSRSYRIMLTTTENGGLLGVARVENSRIHLWAREAGPNGVLEWAPTGTIELKTVLPANSGDITTVAFVHGLGAFFVSTNAGAFTVDLVSNRVRKIFGNSHVNNYFVPYTSFCTPALGYRGGTN